MFLHVSYSHIALFALTGSLFLVGFCFMIGSRLLDRSSFRREPSKVAVTVYSQPRSR